jgi:thioredoxin-dependent peroxiredoxin
MKNILETPLSQITFTSTSDITSLSQCHGHPLILYFYPKDHTPGCTQCAQDFRDYYPSFQQHDAIILGVSRDNLTSHQRFKDKHQLPFDLIADTDEALCQHFDVIKEKNMFGKKVKGIVRSTFLYNADGELMETWSKVKVAGHAEAVLEKLKQMA